MERERVFLSDIKRKYNLDSDYDIIKIDALIRENGYRFETKEGLDFDDFIYDRMTKIEQKRKAGKALSSATFDEEKMNVAVKKELKKIHLRRIIILVSCFVVAAVCLGLYFADYYSTERSKKLQKKLAAMKTETSVANKQSDTIFTKVYKNEQGEIVEVSLNVLEKYENLYKSNSDLIGWLKIDDTNIDYPVLQTKDNEYYLKHNFENENDKNGAIFLDCECSIVGDNDNMIIYGHHMRSGNMFGKLDQYSKKAYYEKHKYIHFDTIYEERLYEVMYVFRSKIYAEDVITFKYYQFINANSAEEFDSIMAEMAKLSLYSTGVHAGYGDELITLSTCDYQEKNGRFVVVAKRVW